VRAHTKLTVERLKHDPLIAESLARGALKVAGGYYSLDNSAASIIA
jgi:carbonic anhydrase